LAPGENLGQAYRTGQRRRLWRRFLLQGCLWSLLPFQLVVVGVVLGLRQCGLQRGGLPRGGLARILFFLGIPVFVCNSSSRVSVPSWTVRRPRTWARG
jgi:hypothetical protein